MSLNKRLADPRRLDVEAFADSASALKGTCTLTDLPRLAEMAFRDSLPGSIEAIQWAVRGERRRAKPGQGHTWLHLTANAELPLVCQRCLQPIMTRIEVNRSFNFVPGEDAAAELDGESDDDVLALTHSLDLQGLLEDELILSLPLVPRHDACPQPLLGPGDQAAVEDAKEHPFASLAALKGNGGQG